ncbi:hypothetical protein SDC9_58067 [bioreactor metagenome]|uniref:Uncharacterized protein n=1 Tax=bioreactor metagenome TaxID=1076179 RepID=A0A644X716_9ZZZZ
MASLVIWLLYLYYHLGFVYIVFDIRNEKEREKLQLLNCPMFQNMDGWSLFLMCLGMGIGLAIGLFLLAGTFYLIWRFIRAIEKRDSH